MRVFLDRDTMALRYLDFDHSEDDADMGTWDAMASVTPEHLPALLAELLHGQRPGRAARAGRRQPLDEGGDWDYDLQTLHEGAAPHQLHYDEASGRVTIEPGAPLQTRHTVTLTLCGTAAFAAALRAHFSLH